MTEFLCRDCGLIFVDSDAETMEHERKVDSDGVDHGDCGGIGDPIRSW